MEAWTFFPLREEVDHHLQTDQTLRCNKTIVHIEYSLVNYLVNIRFHLMQQFITLQHIVNFERKNMSPKHTEFKCF